MDPMIILNSSALLLSIVNGLILVFNFLKNRPNIVLNPKLSENPENNYFFVMPTLETNGLAIRRYCFITYITIINRGSRSTSLLSWELQVIIGDKKVRLLPVTVPSIQFAFSEAGIMKKFTPLGMGDKKEGLLLQSGEIKRGFSCYIIEFISNRDLKIDPNGGKIKAKMIITDSFGKEITTSCSITEISYSIGNLMIPGVGDIFLDEVHDLNQ